MTIKVLAVTSHSDLPETHCFIGLKRQGIDIDIITHPEAPHKQKLIDAGLRVIDLRIKKHIDRRAIKVIRSYLETKDYDILHTYNNSAVLNGLQACKGKNIRFIAYRGIVANVSFLHPGSWLTYLNPRVDKIICVANAIRDYFLKMRFLWLKVPPEKPVTIYKGHHPDWYQSAPRDLSEFGIPKNSFVVGCTANYRPRKGIPYFLDAMDLLPADANIHFLLIGNMPKEKILNRLQSKPYHDRIHFTGYQKNAPAVLAACNACILPAIKREGLPKGIIEGMAYGVPPIVTNSGGSPELIEDGISGIIIPPKSSQAIAEAILSLWRDPDKCKAMGSQAREHLFSHFKIENTIKQTAALYQELLEH